MTCWSPLGGGLLLGKYQKDEKPSPGTRLYYRTEVDGPRFWHQRGFEMAKKLDEVSQKTGISKIQLALSWPLHDKRITSVIIGVKSENQLKENLVVGDWDLPDDVWEEVNKETALDLGHLTQFAGHAYRAAFGEEET